MKIGIHHRENSFSTRWIDTCKSRGIKFKILDFYRSDFSKQIEDCDIILWHPSHAIFKDIIISKNVIFSLDHSDRIVFPDFKTFWHFDDKVAQKYLFELLGLPTVPTFVFYDREEALKWAIGTNFPKVFKLKGGGGSENVKLIRNFPDAKRIINKAFNSGFEKFDRLGYFNERFSRWREGKDNLLDVFKAFYRIFTPLEYSKKLSKEIGYVYFQDFLENNLFDQRIIVIGNKAFGIKRMVREGDFRASGSGNLNFSKGEIDIKCVNLAFFASKKINSQCCAFDFIYDKENNPLIVEVSYGFAMAAYDQCTGYWDDSLTWFNGPFNPQEWILIELIEKFNKKI